MWHNTRKFQLSNLNFKINISLYNYTKTYISFSKYIIRIDVWNGYMEKVVVVKNGRLVVVTDWFPVGGQEHSNTGPQSSIFSISKAWQMVH